MQNPLSMRLMGRALVQLAGTIYTAVEEIEKAGGKGLPCVVDIRQPESVEKVVLLCRWPRQRTDGRISQAVADTVAKFGGLDIVLNNVGFQPRAVGSAVADAEVGAQASAISLTPTEATSVKTVSSLFRAGRLPSADAHRPTVRSDEQVSSLVLAVSTSLMLPFYAVLSINARGTWLVSKFALPHLRKSASLSRNPHILTLAPPLERNLLPSHFGQATAYAIAKFGMSLATLGLSAELKGQVGVNGASSFTMLYYAETG